MQDNQAEKAKILSHCHNKFTSEGFYKTTMDEVSKELQMSKKTIYKYFSSKDSLLDEVCTYRMDFVHSRIQEILDTEDDAVTKFIRIVDMQNSNYMNCSEKWLKDLQLHAPSLMHRFEELRTQKIMTVMSRLLEQGKREKLVENYPAKIIIAAFTGTINSVSDPSFMLNNKFSVQQAFKVTSAIFFSGFLTEKGKEKYANTKKLFENVLS